ncbi:hypothetical protein [Rhizobium herbae]|uniref:Uncharacterized protein n=1 Tax=Rhizobium herbae TaxID=508661 RepID=A0ABS4EG94_9HYPH|nr:hypothetical protein [Rhizobium herbae]MBP1856866.1 hypothetical protein [Rhizobium herbae]
MGIYSDEFNAESARQKQKKADDAAAMERINQRTEESLKVGEKHLNETVLEELSLAKKDLKGSVDVNISPISIADEGPWKARSVSAVFSSLKKTITMYLQVVVDEKGNWETKVSGDLVSPGGAKSSSFNPEELRGLIKDIVREIARLEG